MYLSFCCPIVLCQIAVVLAAGALYSCPDEARRRSKRLKTEVDKGKKRSQPRDRDMEVNKSQSSRRRTKKRSQHEGIDTVIGLRVTSVSTRNRWSGKSWYLVLFCFETYSTDRLDDWQQFQSVTALRNTLTNFTGKSALHRLQLLIHELAVHGVPRRIKAYQVSGTI